MSKRTSIFSMNEMLLPMDDSSNRTASTRRGILSYWHIIHENDHQVHASDTVISVFIHLINLLQLNNDQMCRYRLCTSGIWSDGKGR